MGKENSCIFQETSQSFGSILNLESKRGLERRRQHCQFSRTVWPHSRGPQWGLHEETAAGKITCGLKLELRVARDSVRTAVQCSFDLPTTGLICKTHPVNDSSKVMGLEIEKDVFPPKSLNLPVFLNKALPASIKHSSFVLSSSSWGQPLHQMSQEPKVLQGLSEMF